MTTLQAIGKDAEYQRRLNDLPPYEQWARENPLQASDISADQYSQISHDQIVREVYDSNRDPRSFSWLGDGNLQPDPKAPWYALNSLPGGYGMYPANPTIQRVAGGVIAAITVTALLAWGGQLDRNDRPDPGNVPVERK
jgi:hypothetical protein